jgi:hypothetical protein
MCSLYGKRDQWCTVDGIPIDPIKSVEHPEDEFYMCLVEGSKTSHVKHRNRTEALAEAERLSQLPDNVGKRVYIMKPETSVVTRYKSEWRKP